MFLATSALREFWDHSQDLLLMGPWCLPPGQGPGPRQSLLPCLWDDRERLDAGIAYCHRTHLELVERLADYLNAALGLGLDRRYWQTLIGPWALFYTHQAYSCYCRLSTAFEAHPGLKSCLLPESEFHIPWDTLEYTRFFARDRFNLQLASSFMRGLGKDFPELSLSACAREEPLPAPSRAGLKSALRAAAESLASWAVRYGPCEVLTDELYPMSGNIWRLIAARGFTLWPLRRTLPEQLRCPALGDSRRRGLAGLAFKDEFGRLLAKSLPCALPSLYLEGFPAARDYVRASLGRVPALVLAGSYLYYNDFFKLAVAELSLRGARVMGFQHGGAYGTTKALVAEAHERAVTDAFLTWGWSSLDCDPRLRDVAVPHVSESLRRGPAPWRENEGILYATSEGIPCPHHLFHSPLEQQWEEFFLERDRFLRALPQELLSLLSLRLNPIDFGWRQRAKLRESFPNLRLDDNGTAYLKRLKQVRIVVTDHPTSAFLEALALGVPSVHFWRSGHWELREPVRPAFEALREAGIAHQDPESAARHLSEIYSDPAPWWESERVRKARGEFVRLFARTDPDWVSAWSRLIDGELAVSRRGTPSSSPPARSRAGHPRPPRSC